MQYELLACLGIEDAKICNQRFGAGLDLDAEKLKAGCIIELPKLAVAYLTGTKAAKGRGLVALLKPVETVKAQAKKPELTAPAK